jgi:hypothetical protein
LEIDRAGKAACALCVWVGYTNHSCAPNAEVVPDCDGLVHLQALRAIAPGEELRFSYVDRGAPWAQRQSVLLQHYGFECRCSRCLDEDPNKTARRAQAKLDKKRVATRPAAPPPRRAAPRLRPISDGACSQRAR